MLKNIKQVSHTKTFYYKDALKVLLYLREKLCLSFANPRFETNFWTLTLFTEKVQVLISLM